eukprot:m.91140 g.91140  ORF g.91140 m.91140 type:complete len:52 (+) comp11912_c0_seq2:152-307(+)
MRGTPTLWQFATSDGTPKSALKVPPKKLHLFVHRASVDSCRVCVLIVSGAS